MIKVYKSSEHGALVVDSDSLSDTKLLDTFQKATKKPIVSLVLQMPEEFEVVTINGPVNGKKGDWVIIDTEGYPYPCDEKIFNDTYNLNEK